MLRSLNQWVEYIQTLHPRSIDLSLERVALVWKKFRPDSLPPTIAIAGTNGKGSSVSMLESVYRHAGYQTGAFTSPHLVHFNERFCLNNVPVSDDILLGSFEQIESLRGDTQLTFFEFNLLLALDIFCNRNLDVILLEVGLGGRLDAVNVVDNDLALITSIGIDHTAWLGINREQIGVEKAGIIKTGGMAVLADPDAPRSLYATAISKQARFVQADVDYQVKPGYEKAMCFVSQHPDLSQYSDVCFMTGLKHEYYNRAGVVAAIAMLGAKLPISTTQILTGLQKQFLRGRLQLIPGTPRILLDVSHNEASVLSMLEYIDAMHIKGRIHAVFGALADKDYGEAYEALKLRIDAWYLSTLEGERGQSAADLHQKLFTADSVLNVRSRVELFTSPENAFSRAKMQALGPDLIVIFGSFHLVGAIIPILIS